MNFNPLRLRQLHRALVPVMVLPLLLTLTTGVLFQFAVASDRANDFIWLLDLHRGKFGQINLDFVYPFLNALGLLTLLITGVLMWLKTPSKRTRKSG
ncbi:PepSY domain-containing protein [Almyronema epifaneia]|uniref:PepSY domain-containing protein n=1 Tax=Almyronema epifaneia S1 TaxID=2991925 RepID=A0ABW6IMI0_9CYAN